MSRPDPIEYAERLYAAIRAANFSPISFLAFGNGVKEGVSLRSLPRIAVEPFMRVVGEMLDLEDEASADDDAIDVDVADKVPVAQAQTGQSVATVVSADVEATGGGEIAVTRTESTPCVSPEPQERRRSGGER